MTSDHTPSLPQPFSRPCVVAIDGPAASGKSSTAHWVAERLGFRHVDSGALYRAVTALMLRSGRPPSEWSESDVLAGAAGVSLTPDPADPTAFVPTLSGAPLGEDIRGSMVTQHVSRVASLQGVRAWVNERVREAARGQCVVVDGRDIGTVVFPKADLKVFLVADPWERARRRLVQRLSRRPTDEEVAGETERLVQRDARDATQTVPARDAVIIDTTYLTQEEQVERIVALVKVVSRRTDDTSGRVAD